MPDGLAEFFVKLFKYGLVGTLTVVTQVSIYIILATVLQLSGLISYTFAVIVSLVVAYFGQSRWTFADRKSRSVWKYSIIVIVSFCMGSGSTWVIVDWARLSPLWALPVMIVVIPFMSFLMLRAWAFR